MYNAVRNLYSNCESCIRLNNLHTEWFAVRSGVRQGDSISPTLFALYLNEFAKEIKQLNLGVKLGNVDVSILLYADDMVLLANNEHDLQIMLNKMHEWCHKWRLKVNISKSNIVHFRPPRAKLTQFVFQYGDKNLEIVNEYKYLGVILDQHLSFKTCSKTLADSGGRALSAVMSKFKQFKDIGFNTFTRMFESCVAPVLDYGSGVWGFVKANHSDIVQNKAYRYFLGVHNFTPIAAMQSEMGWLPSKYRKYMNMLRLWNRLIAMPNDRLTKCVFNQDCLKSQNNNWSSAIKNVFALIGQNSIFQNREQCDLSICQTKLKEKAEDEWKLTVELKPKLRTFKTFKTDCNTSEYVKWSMNRYDRSLLAKFRCGILQLRIETGRFNNTKLEERTCEICESTQIEDEFHFLCVCNAYEQLRTDMFTRTSQKYPHFQTLSLKDKFIFLLIKCNRELIKFLKLAWDLRKNILYN